MPVEAILDTMVDCSFRVVEYQGQKPVRNADGMRLGPFGMEVRSDRLPPNRFAWMGFDLPGGRHVKALAEVVGVLADEDARDRVIVRFKHVFPNDRLVMSDFFQARAAA